MIGWRRSFRAELLGAWKRAGLPDPGLHERAYDELCAAAAPATPPAEDRCGPLDPATTQSVFGFGYAIGAACAGLLGIRGAAARESADWCARFNLGISLVDWLCDEAKLPTDEVAALPAFSPLVGRRGGTRSPARAETRYLDALARGLLAELAREAGPPAVGEPRSALWPSLRRMLRAELASAEAGFFDPTRPTAKLSQMRLKSVEPFRVMAERAVLGRKQDPSGGRVGAARRLGRAIGECVWLTDDADDLWRDLDAGRGNRFLAEAAAADSRVLAPDGRMVDMAVARVLQRERVAERLCARAAGRFAATLRSLPCDRSGRECAAGLVGVALARWSE